MPTGVVLSGSSYSMMIAAIHRRSPSMDRAEEEKDMNETMTLIAGLVAGALLTPASHADKSGAPSWGICSVVGTSSSTATL